MLNEIGTFLMDALSRPPVASPGPSGRTSPRSPSLLVTPPQLALSVAQEARARVPSPPPLFAATASGATNAAAQGLFCGLFCSLCVYIYTAHVAYMVHLSMTQAPIHESARSATTQLRRRRFRRRRLSMIILLRPFSRSALRPSRRHKSCCSY